MYVFSFNVKPTTSANYGQYPVITAHQASRKDWMTQDPNLLSTSTNRNLFQPSHDHKTRKRSEIRESLRKGKDRSNSRSGKRVDAIESKLTHEDRMSGTSHSDRSQLVDLVVQDTEAEEAGRVRA